jgi:glutathione peroxidase
MTLIKVSFVTLTLGILLYFFLTKSKINIDTNDTVYKFNFSLKDQSILSLNSYNGKVILIVNTASNCGFTGQYAELESLYQQYKDNGLVIIAVPSNDFKQEQEANKEIAKFCQINYGITFPLTNKEVVTGKNAHPFYKWAQKLGLGTTPMWNFHKYLIDRNGHLVDFFYPQTTPKNNNLIKKIEKLLEE